MIMRELNQRAYDKIRRRILDGEFLPSSPISEYQLATELNFSRTPVREALKRLEEKGLVWSIPKKGTFIAELSAHDIMEIYQVRERLEGMAALIAAEQMSEKDIQLLEKEIALLNELKFTGRVDEIFQCDIRLHKLIIASTQNIRLGKILATLDDQMHRVRIIFSQTPDWIQAVIQDHATLVEKIKAHDGKGAENAMVQHLRSSCDRSVQIVLPLRRS
ncbi:MAG: GntR family transcriptional regulator [Planctomycetes bacterium]|nr:GntR family transcriptional regulator [Planctomycetota bacterium]